MKYIGLVMVMVCTWGGLLITFSFDFPKFAKTMLLIAKALPGEFVIIFGCAVCAFIIANTGDVIGYCMKYLGSIGKPKSYSKADYIELFSTLFTVFKLARTKGWLALESHIENPNESDLFGQYPSFQNNQRAITFLCDYLRIISLGNENPGEIGSLMSQEIDVISKQETTPGAEMQVMADGIPALGIVAAVLGVIKTMGSINEPPEILGKMIGGALVGTFLGVWLSYAIVGPLAGAMKQRAASEIQYYKIIKTCMVSFLSGAAPQVAVEFGRKTMSEDVRPEFAELEERLNELPAPS